ncbi:MAG: family 20 glycosylhydrolase [Microbacterium sp.]
MTAVSPLPAPARNDLEEAVPIIPAPAHLVADDGHLGLDTLASLTVSDPAAAGVAEQLRSALRLWTAYELPEATVGAPAQIGVHLRLDAGPATAAHRLEPEGEAAHGAYTLDVDDTGITVTARTTEGLHRGATTLVQLIGATEAGIPYLHVRDRAEFAWRGLSLDTVRAFVEVAEVKRIIDLLSLYKLNVLHLHLSDNEGWRLQIASWPQLTRPDADGRRQFYTQDEVRDIVRYARDRFITVIPEIDLPGHVAAAVRAYPELADPDSPIEGPFPRAYLDASSPVVQRFVEDVVGDLVSVTDGPYVHIGGDEAFGMPDEDHAAFISRAVALVRRLGKRAVAWQEASRADIGAAETVQHWIDFAAPETSDEDTDDEVPARDVEDASHSGIPADVLTMLKHYFAKASGDSARTAEKGARVLLSPNSHTYLDRPHAESSLNEEQEQVRGRLGLAHYPPTPLEVYVDWNPYEVVAAELRPQIVGVEGAVWCETVTSTADLEMLLLPRLPGIAEAAWTPPNTERDLAVYRGRLAHHAALWDRAGWNWFEADTVDWTVR